MGRWLLQGAVYGGGVLTQYVDGMPIGSVTRTYATGSGGVRLGEEINGGKNLNMDVAEVLVYDRALTSGELDTLTTYLASRYGLGPGGRNTAPAVTITSPAEGTSVEEGTAVSFVGTASDPEDGSLTAALTWTSSVDGALGTGAASRGPCRWGRTRLRRR